MTGPAFCDLTQRPTEPGEFADDQAVAALEDAHQLVELAGSDVGPAPGKPVFSGQVDVFPSEQRDVGQEFGRDVEAGVLPGEDGLTELPPCSNGVALFGGEAARQAACWRACSSPGSMTGAPEPNQTGVLPRRGRAVPHARSHAWPR